MLRPIPIQSFLNDTFNLHTKKKNVSGVNKEDSVNITEEKKNIKIDSTLTFASLSGEITGRHPTVAKKKKKRTIRVIIFYISVTMAN